VVIFAELCQHYIIESGNIIEILVAGDDLKLNPFPADSITA